jgi:glycine cleavage system H protein
MEGFSYNNIFDTKGIEYLIIIGFLFLIIPFWILINKQAEVKMKFKKTIGILSDSILKIPRGLFYNGRFRRFSPSYYGGSQIQ